MLLTILAIICFILAGYVARAPQQVYKPVTRATRYNGGRK